PVLILVHRPFSHCLFFYSYGDHPILPSFPTRRSSDLALRPPVSSALVFSTAATCSWNFVRVSATGLSCASSLAWASCSRLRKVSDRKSTRLNSSHVKISYAVYCLKKKRKTRCKIYIDR